MTHCLSVPLYWWTLKPVSTVTQLTNKFNWSNFADSLRSSISAAACKTDVMLSRVTWHLNLTHTSYHALSLFIRSLSVCSSSPPREWGSGQLCWFVEDEIWKSCQFHRAEPPHTSWTWQISLIKILHLKNCHWNVFIWRRLGLGWKDQHKKWLCLSIPDWCSGNLDGYMLVFGMIIKRRDGKTANTRAGQGQKRFNPLAHYVSH